MTSSQWRATKTYQMGLLFILRFLFEKGVFFDYKMNFYSKIFFVVIVLPLSGFSQKPNDYLLEKADSFFDLKLYESASGFYYQDFKSKFNNEDVQNSQLSFINYIICSFKIGKYSEVIDSTSYWLSKFENNENIDKFLLGKTYLYKALTHRKLEEFSNSLNEYKNAIHLYESIKANDPNVAYAYKNAAQILIRNLDYSKATYYLETALKSDSTAKENIYIFNQLAGLCQTIKNEKDALKYYLLGKKMAKDVEQIAYSSATGAPIYYLLNDLERSKSLYLIALDYFKKNPKNWEATTKCYTSLSEIEYELGNIKLSKQYMRLAVKIANDYSKFKSREAARTYVYSGELFMENKEINNALAHYQQALIQVFPNFNSTNITDNPSINDIYTESWIMTASARKAEALRARYEINKDIADLKNAAACFDLSLAGVKALNDSYGTDNAKIYLSDYSHNVFEEAIEVNYLLYRATDDPQYLEKIFSIMERSKATVLSEAIQKNRALILAGIPDSLLEQEKDLRLELADLNTSIKREELNEAEADSGYISELRSRSVTKQREYEALLEVLRDNYPAFRSFSEERLTPTIADVQAYLTKEKRALLEYFVGEKNIYLIKMEEGSTGIYQLPRTGFWDDQVADFQDYFRSSAVITSDPDGYFTAAARLYQQLFPFEQLPESVIIVPDAELNFIPFDALVAERPETPNFLEAEFLVKKHLIHYAYSVGLLLRASERHHKRGVLLRVAPVFAGRERGLATLGSEDAISPYFKNLQTLGGPQATLSAFRKVASQCRMIEFFTHAGADEADFAPRIEFIDTALYLPELYAMDIPAELIVLNACETGLGKFEKGEGVMSLARGFAYSGASDLVASLWKVNAGSTATITDHFYKNLKEGKTKSGALRAAKLQYLEEVKSEDKLSPYYWAGFVSIGPDGSMDFTESNWYWWLLLTGGVIVAIWIWLKKPDKEIL